MADLHQHAQLVSIYDLNYPGGIAQLQISSVGAREFMDRHPARYVEFLTGGQVATFAGFTRIIIDGYVGQ